jgi:hypothetical protein
LQVYSHLMWVGILFQLHLIWVGLALDCGSALPLIAGRPIYDCRSLQLGVTLSEAEHGSELVKVPCTLHPFVAMAL